MKKILGLDLGTTSVGWAMVTVAEKAEEKASILGCGSRVVPVSTDEKDNYEKGKASTTNADRTAKRGMRRNLQRRRQRRDNLIKVLNEAGWINADTILSEDGKGTTHETLRLRAEAASQEISLSDLAKVLLSICNKRGYKSNRKAGGEDEGQLIDGMQIAKELAEKGITPAQYTLGPLEAGKYARFDFYRSDLEAEFDRIWEFQRRFHPEILTGDFKNQLSRQGRQGTSKIFLAKYQIYTADNKGKDKRLQAIRWRVQALSQELPADVLAFVIADLRGEISNSSGYLGEISDRSKELFFHDETIGQYLYRSMQSDPLFRARGKVFYRQDYLDEFNRIWSVQAKFHPGMTPALRKKIADNVIFYQRPLRSQKGLVSFCEFESRPVKVIVDGKEKTKITGSRVAPRSSLLFQEFKVYQVLNNLAFINKMSGVAIPLTEDERKMLFGVLSLNKKLTQAFILKLLGRNPRKFKLNYEVVPGNETIDAIFSKYNEVVTQSGNGEFDLQKSGAVDGIREVFKVLGCNADIFTFDSSLPKERYEQQPLFKLWHLLYSYEGDNSATGTDSLISKICELTGLEREYARIISGIQFKEDYASLSHKAIYKILPYLKQGYRYDEACALAGYNHSHSLTREELDSKPLADRLEILPKGALRNPVVEKIINQMINVVNAAADFYGKPDEIHIELARELKQNAQERARATEDIAAGNARNEEITEIIKRDFGKSSVSKSDILRYRLYDELKGNGYKTLYSNRYISPAQLFSKDIDIEHIIPQALLFNDSFANKTLEFKEVNIEKGRRTANDFVKEKYGQDEYEQYRLRIDDLCERKAITDRKRSYLLMTEKDIPEGFIERDLRNTQYISKKSREILEGFVKEVLPTTGSVTDCLRQQWQLVDVMKEINYDKYDRIGRTYIDEDEDGNRTKRIEGWTKRDDHRHHAMDAITIAFTRREHINILNHLNAKSDRNPEYYALLGSNTFLNAKNKRIFNPPMPLEELRAEFRRSLNSALVSIKTKNKVVTRNVNKTKCAGGENRSVELTPRGALHKEQVYGRRRRYKTYEVAVGSKMTEEVIATVASKRVREAFMRRLQEFGGDAKKAFTGKNSLDKNPIHLNPAETVPSKVKCVCFETYYSIRKDVSPDLTVEKVVDAKARRKIEERIRECGGKKREALSNLDQNPIWMDDAHTIPLKRVTIGENQNMMAIRDKRDKNGNLILDDDGHIIPNDYVNLNSNHHVALYIDAAGKVQEQVVSMFEAVTRVNAGLPIVDKTYNEQEGWKFFFSMKINEMFVFPNAEEGFCPKEIDLLDPANAAIISPHLFRVQRLSQKYYVFRHHLETTVSNDDMELKGITWDRITNIQKMADAVKVRVNHLGQIVAVGEYD